MQGTQMQLPKHPESCWNVLQSKWSPRSEGVKVCAWGGTRLGLAFKNRCLSDPYNWRFGTRYLTKKGLVEKPSSGLCKAHPTELCVLRLKGTSVQNRIKDGGPNPIKAYPSLRVHFDTNRVHINRQLWLLYALSKPAVRGVLQARQRFRSSRMHAFH